MTNAIIAMFVFMSLTISCGKGGGSSSSSKQSAESATTAVKTEGSDIATGNNDGNSSQTPPSSISTSSTVPAQALSFGTNITLMGFDAAQTDKYNKAIAIVKKVVATDAFRSRVLNFTWNGAKQYANNKGLTNAQIYQSILDAAESLKPIKNNTMDLGVKLYYENSTVIGYTNHSITYINVNTKFFNNFAPNQVAGNLFHEWLHKIGYDHDSASTPQRPYSVPYAVGYIVRDLGKNFL